MPFLSLFAAVLLRGIADSMVSSYIVLFGADVVGLTPLQVGVWASVFAIGGIAVGWWLGRRFDRRPARTYAIVVTLLGSAGYLLLPRVSSYLVLLLMAATVLGAMGAAFPQLFALARSVLGEGEAGQRSAPLLRSAWSLAWAVGPLLGALVLSRGGYSWLMWTAAAVFLASALTVLVVPRPGSVAVAHSSPGGTPVLLTVSVTLFFTATFAGGLALPLFLTRALHQQPASVGVLFSVCAAVEVVAFRGVGIAIVGAAGIRYFQDLLAPATGRATTLFANASTAGLLASGILSGVAVEQLGYRTTFFRCGVAAALGGVAFTLGSRSQAGRRHLQKVRPHVQRGGEDRTGVSPTVLPPGSGIVCIVCRDYRRRT